MTDIRIPDDLKPADGRFGSGPSKVRATVLDRIAGSPLMGTSHRQTPVKDLVGRIRSMLSELYALPEGYQVVFGNGGSTLFWDAAVCSLIKNQSAHGVFGAFSRKFYAAAKNAPFLEEPVLAEAPDGQLALPGVGSFATGAGSISDADVVCWPQNETSTGVAAPIVRPASNALVLIDATSAAGGMTADLSEVDTYYFSPQKNFASDGGLWLAFLSPAALQRISVLTSNADGRWIPDMLNLQKAVTNSAKNQTLNTPAIATLLMVEAQLVWLAEIGGIAASAQRCRHSSDHVYRWAEASSYASPFVADPELRSPVVATVELSSEVDRDVLLQVLRQNSIVDIGAYRGVGKNQIRIGTFTAVDFEDVEKLTACIDWVVERIR